MKTETNNNTEQGHNANTVLAVSGLTELIKIRNHFVTTLPVGEVTAWDMIRWAKDFTRYIDETIHEAEKAACASGAVDTVAEGEGFELNYCKDCIQMTNHKCGKCQKCAVRKSSEGQP